MFGGTKIFFWGWRERELIEALAEALQEQGGRVQGVRVHAEIST